MYATSFGGIGSNADDIDPYPRTPGRSLGPHRASRQPMVLTVGERPCATVCERRSRQVVRLAAIPALLSPSLDAEAREIRGDYGTVLLASFLINAWEAAVLRPTVERMALPSRNSNKSCSRNAYPVSQQSEE